MHWNCTMSYSHQDHFLLSGMWRVPSPAWKMITTWKQRLTDLQLPSWVVWVTAPILPSAKCSVFGSPILLLTKRYHFGKRKDWGRSERHPAMTRVCSQQRVGRELLCEASAWVPLSESFLLPVCGRETILGMGMMYICVIGELLGNLTEFFQLSAINFVYFF